jgi:hypothetical protein
MSANPARTFGPAVYASYWNTLWIYFLAPPVGMLAASELFLLVRHGKGPYCAKLHHHNNKRCIFSHSGADPAPAETRAARAEACDVPVRWSCRTGVCHSCESGLVSGAVVYRPEPLDNPADGNILVCCSQPQCVLAGSQIDDHIVNQF